MRTSSSSTIDALDNILRLRRLRRHVDNESRDDVDSVLSYLEETVSPTLGRAVTARMLGISHTALDRWIAKGDISTVLTPTGRREVPLPEVIDLLESLAEDEAASGSVADVIRERRLEAEAIPEDTFLTPKRRRPMTHRVADLQALAYHRQVAQKLDEAIRADARRRLDRWERTTGLTRAGLSDGARFSTCPKIKWPRPSRLTQRMDVLYGNRRHSPDHSTITNVSV